MRMRVLPDGLKRDHVIDGPVIVETSGQLTIRGQAWRESVGIEPTSRLTTASAVLKTVRATRPVLSRGQDTNKASSRTRPYSGFWSEIQKPPVPFGVPSPVGPS